jgi:ATP-binding cassette subfamily B protein
MDSWAEVDWFDRFREMVNDNVGIVITHRFTIAMRADIIHVIHEGNIIESGTHKELLESKGFYASSWESQMATAKVGNFDGKPAEPVSAHLGADSFEL